MKYFIILLIVAGGIATSCMSAKRVERPGREDHFPRVTFLISVSGFNKGALDNVLITVRKVFGRDLVSLDSQEYDDAQDVITCVAEIPACRVDEVCKKLLLVPRVSGIQIK